MALSDKKDEGMILTIALRGHPSEMLLCKRKDLVRRSEDEVLVNCAA